jgi:hypothetical protein
MRRSLQAGCVRVDTHTALGRVPGTLAATAVDGRGRPLGHVAFNVPAGKARTVRLAIVSPARQALAHRRTAHLVLRATVRGDGRSHTVVRRLTLRLG